MTRLHRPDGSLWSSKTADCWTKCGLRCSEEVAIEVDELRYLRLGDDASSERDPSISEVGSPADCRRLLPCILPRASSSVAAPISWSSRGVGR